MYICCTKLNDNLAKNNDLLSCMTLTEKFVMLIINKFSQS